MAASIALNGLGWSCRSSLGTSISWLTIHPLLASNN